jgi:hypothetical protein
MPMAWMRLAAIVRAMMEVPTERTPLAAAALMERRWSAASSIE